MRADLVDGFHVAAIVPQLSFWQAVIALFLRFVYTAPRSLYDIFRVVSVA
jgi:hypothetical protein